ncbi:hypothetical protein DLAC_09025 [Tieghemostelium lacteum]|uniref:Sugar transporter SWEET1 n=1 Tax=Tieghemostelium lacteum TaxID=361077 RepID=A0A151Z8Y9_TIELA|nr:hypothetical protein DLAC_09025 [Tieghemostelium lacteum]|eukprot:KYQ90406.1 hypothetical protein DLAC_09025 [Tieghemostelium lacteum]
MDQSEVILPLNSGSETESSHSYLLGLFSLLATFITISLYFGPYSTIKQIIQKKSVGSVAGLQFIMTSLSCFLWVCYAVLTSNKTMFLVNNIGFILSSYYAYIYWLYSHESKFKFQVIGGFLIGVSILGFSFSSSDHQVRVDNLGILSCVICVLMFASPLEKLSSVIRLKNSDGMLKQVAIGSLLCGLSWTVFGLLIDDVYVYGPNILASILSFIQVSLILVYPPPNLPMHGSSSIVDQVY